MLLMFSNCIIRSITQNTRTIMILTLIVIDDLSSISQKENHYDHESGLLVIVCNGRAIGIGSRDEYYPGK